MSNGMDIDAPRVGIHAGLSKFLASGQFSDLVITCYGREFKVHKAIICSQSPVLLNACKPGGFQESQSGIIDLPDDNPLLVEAMISFMYEFKVKQPQKSADTKTIIQFYTDLFALADKYGVSQLQQQIVTTFRQLLHSQQIEGILTAIEITYTTSGVTDLRAAVVDNAQEGLERYLENTKFKKLMRCTAEFGGDLVEKSMSEAQEADKMKGYVRFVCEESIEGLGLPCNLEFMVDLAEYYGDCYDMPFSFQSGELACVCPCCGGTAEVTRQWRWEGGPHSGDRNWERYDCAFYGCSGLKGMYCSHRGRQRDLDQEGNLPRMRCLGCGSQTMLRC